MGISITCAAGAHSATCRIVLHVVDGDALPETVTLNQSSYTVEVGETLEIDTSVTCGPAGAALPEDAEVTLEASRAFWNALAEDTYFADFSCAFAAPGEYAATLVYAGANYRYALPITVRVKDENGAVPVTVQDIALSADSLELFVDETATLTAEVHPSDAATGGLTWSSFNTAVATVSSDGKVTAVGAGYTYILLTAEKTDFTVLCPVTVEDGLTLEEEALNRTVFVDGATRTGLSTVYLTGTSSRRLDSAPEWQLKRVSGNNLTLRAAGCETVNAAGDTIYGCALTLHSVSAVGTTIYDLICAAGDEETELRVVVNAVDREGNVPASIALSQTVYEAGEGELITVGPEVACWPAGTRLPEGTTVSFDVDRQFLNAVNQDDWFVSQSVSTFSFLEAGRYTANMVFNCSNISYVVPITFNIRDARGDVPVHGVRVGLNAASLQMVAGETRTLEAVFTPADVTNRQVAWSSSDPGVAAVDAQGRVTAVANGSANITCTPADAHCEPVACQVYVEDYLTVNTGSTNYACYLEGKGDNPLSSAWLSEGTRQRLARDGIEAA